MAGVKMADQVQSVFVMTVKDRQELRQTRLLIQSLRAFGGELRNCPVWVYVPDGSAVTTSDFKGLKTEIYPLDIPDTVRNYWFARKVCTCTQAERAATQDIHSLIWAGYDCLIIQAPVLLQLRTEYDAAFRPVHGRNVGLPVCEPLNDFWQAIYERIKLPESTLSVESYVDCQQLRAYFNSHIFSWNPRIGLGQCWFEVFSALVGDQSFQAKACQEIQYQVFLHQAILSALVEKLVSPDRLCILPPDYRHSRTP
jgi:hypothetical protein